MSSNNNINVTFKASLDKFKSSLSSVGRETKTTTGNFGSFYNTLRKNNNAFSNLTKDANRASASIGNLNKVLKGVSIYAIGDYLAKAIQSNIDMIETTNLFSVSMGELAVETGKTVDAMSDLTGLDATNIRNAIGTYGLLARSMGMSNKQSQILSTNTYKLGLDLSSLANLPINQVMQDLRSGLVGQSETMYKYGVDVTEATLKQEAMNQGIEKSVRNMSQGEKMALRYAVMLRQTSLAHGNFAETINTPTNQLKVLASRMVTLSRSIGSLFIPMLSAVLPYLNAFVRALTLAIDALAKLFGYKKPEDENIESSLDGVKDSAEDATGAIGKMAKAVKSLNKLGIDELNVISPEEPKTGGDGVTGAIAGSLEGFNIEGYDNLFDSISQQSDVLVEKMKLLLDLIVKIGIILLSWKVSNLILDILTNPMLGKGLLDTVTKLAIQFGILTSNGKLATGVGMAGVIAIMALRFYDLYKNSEQFRTGLSRLGEIFKGVFKGISTIVNEVFEGVKKLGDRLLDLLPENVKAPILKFFNKFSELASKLDLDIFDLVLTIGGFALLGTPLGVPLLIFEALSVAVRALGGISEESWTKIKKTMVDAFTKALEFIKTAISDWWANDVIPYFTKERWKETVEVVKTSIVNMWTNFTDWWNTNLPIWWENYVIPWFTLNKWVLLVTSILTSFQTVWGQVKTSWTNSLSVWWNDSVAPWFTKKKWVDIMVGVKEGFQQTFKNAINVAIGLFNNFIDWVNEKMEFKWNDIKIAGVTVVPSGQVQLINIPRIPQLARGGMLENGQLFEAGEMGKAEAIGKYNGKTTVMPLENTDFVLAMYDAVKTAMIESQANGGQVINNILELDGEVIYKNQQKVSSDRGFNFGMGVFGR